MKTNLSRTEFLQKLKSLDLSKLNSEPLEYRNNILTINSEGESRNIFLYIPDKEKIENIKKKFVSVYKSMQKLLNYIIFKKPELLQIIQKNGLSIEGLKKRNTETFLGYARIDTLYGSGDFKLVEFNSRRPQMYEDADFYSDMMINLLGKENIFPEQNALGLMESIENQFQINTEKDFPETIIIITKFWNQKYSYSTSIQIKKFFSKSKIIFLDCEDLDNFYTNCDYKDGNLIYKNNKIELIFIQSICGKKSIYNLNGKIKNPKIEKAYEEGNLELYTSPSGQISGTKLSLELLTDPEIQKALDLTIEEIENLNIIPKSILSKNIKNLSDFDKNKYVIKLTGIGQGKGVILGENLSDEEWKSTFEKEINSGQNFILQEKINFEVEEIFDLQTKQFRKAYITLEPFVMNNPKTTDEPFITGFSTRAIPIEDFSQGMKFNPAGDNQKILFGAVVETK